MKATVLLSGGIDSTTCLALAVKKIGREMSRQFPFFTGNVTQKKIAAHKK